MPELLSSSSFCYSSCTSTFDFSNSAWSTSSCIRASSFLWDLSLLDPCYLRSASWLWRCSRSCWRFSEAATFFWIYSSFSIQDCCIEAFS